MKPDRRIVLAATAGLLAPTPAATADAQAEPPAITRILARYIANACLSDIASNVRRGGWRLPLTGKKEPSTGLKGKFSIYQLHSSGADLWRRRREAVSG